MTVARDRPTASAASACVSPNSSMSRCSERASSMGFRSSRWMFSMSATATADSSGMSRMTAGIVCRPAICAARQRRSPATISYSVSPPVTFGSGRTTIGCTTPCALIDSASSVERVLAHVDARLVLAAAQQVDGHLAQARFGRLGRRRRGSAEAAGGGAGRALLNRASRPRPRLFRLFIGALTAGRISPDCSSELKTARLASACGRPG